MVYKKTSSRLGPEHGFGPIEADKSGGFAAVQRLRTVLSDEQYVELASPVVERNAQLIGYLDQAMSGIHDTAENVTATDDDGLAWEILIHECARAHSVLDELIRSQALLLMEGYGESANTVARLIGTSPSTPNRWRKEHQN